MNTSVKIYTYVKLYSDRITNGGHSLNYVLDFCERIDIVHFGTTI